MSDYIEDGSLCDYAQEVYGQITVLDEPVQVKFEYSVSKDGDIRVTSCKEIGSDIELVGLFKFSNDIFAVVEDEIAALIEAIDDLLDTPPSFGYNGSVVE